MSGRDVASELANMAANLEQKTGRSMSAWIEVVLASGKAKHGEMISYLKDQHGLGHGYANLVAHAAREKAAGRPVAEEDVIAAQYVGKEGLRPIYDSLIKIVSKFGDDVAPKKAGVSLQRSKQFALIEPTTKTRIDIGINLKGMAPTDRLKAAGGMCTHKVGVTGLDQVDDELISWLREAYERA
jgi:hypothetical protein